jgi:hypothetical protein
MKAIISKTLHPNYSTSLKLFTTYFIQQSFNTN